MAKDVNIHVKTPGAQQAKQRLNEIGQAGSKVGEQTATAAGKGADGMDRLSRSTTSTKRGFGKLVTSLSSWAARLVGITAIIGGITGAIRAQRQAIEEHARIVESHQKKLLSLQFMGGFFKEHPEARKEVAAYAEFGRRPFEEVATAWYALESKGAGLTTVQKQGIMREALELGRQEPEADLKGIIEMFSLYAKETRQKDINLIQNVLLTMTKAGAELSQVGQYMPEFLPVGMGGGLTGPQSAGLWAYATTKLKEPSRATVGLRNIFMALEGKGTPESQKLIQQLGITGDMDFFQKLEFLSGQQQADRFSLGQAELIAGKENAAFFLSMLKNPQAMMQTIASVSGTARGDVDLVGRQIQELMGQDEIARMEEESRRLDVAIANIKGRDIEAMKWNVYLKDYERQMREAGVPEYIIKEQLFIEGIKAGIGLEPGALKRATSPISWGPGPSMPFAETGAPVTINDHSTNYYPRVGDDQRGPRFDRNMR